MKKVIVAIVVLIVIGGIAGGAFYLYRQSEKRNNVVNGEIISSVPTAGSVKTLVEKYPLNMKEYQGVTVSNFDNSVLWIFGRVETLEQDFTSQEGTLQVLIYNENLEINITKDTKFSKAKTGRTIAETEYTLIRSQEIRRGDSVYVTASYVDGKLVASEIQKRLL